VLIAPKDSDLAGFDQLGYSRVRLIALGDPASVPAGQYGKQTLESLQLYDKVSSKLVLGQNVRQVLTYIETGNADAGLVYATDAQTSTKIRVVSVAPEGSHDPIEYPLAEMRQSQNDRVTRAFIGFLKSPSAQKIFEKFGFGLG
jgi:molybdate transport system substrate-binding protein